MNIGALRWTLGLSDRHRESQVNFGALKRTQRVSGRYWGSSGGHRGSQVGRVSEVNIKALRWTKGVSEEH